MKFLSKEKYLRELEKIKIKNHQKELRQSLKDEKSKYRKKFKIETSKLIAIYLLLLLNAIVIYAMVSMWKFADLSYLGVLISDIAAQILIYAIYCMKAYKGKKAEEDMKFKREQNGSLGDILKAGAEHSEPVPTTIGIVDDLEVETDIESVG